VFKVSLVYIARPYLKKLKNKKKKARKEGKKRGRGRGGKKERQGIA
jgi:hypothetical protein